MPGRVREGVVQRTGSVDGGIALEDVDGVALAVALEGSGETGETGADDEDIDAGLLVGANGLGEGAFLSRHDCGGGFVRGVVMREGRRDDVRVGERDGFVAAMTMWIARCREWVCGGLADDWGRWRNCPGGGSRRTSRRDWGRGLDEPVSEGVE